MLPLSERLQLVNWIEQAISEGARQGKACEAIGLPVRTLQRWKQSGRLQEDNRKTRLYTPRNKLTDAERERIITIANRDEFRQMAPHQIVPVLAERGEYIASESSFYRVLRAEKQLTHRHSSRVPVTRSKPKALTATAPNQLYSWDITYCAPNLWRCYG
jgi:putative transposase